MRYASVIVCLLGLAAGGCLKAPDDNQAPTETTEEAPAQDTAGPGVAVAEVDQTIDWDAAREAKAAGPAVDSAVSVQSVTGQTGLAGFAILAGLPDRSIFACGQGQGGRR